MRGLSTSSTRPNALSPYLYGRYSAPKQRWWPLFACLGWVGCSGLRCYRSHLKGLNQRKGLWSTRPLDQVCWRRRNLPLRKSLKCPVFRTRRPTIQPRRAWQNPRQRGVRLFRSIRPGTARPVIATRRGNRTIARFSVTHAMARIHERAMALTAAVTAVGLSTRLHRYQPHVIWRSFRGLA